MSLVLKQIEFQSKHNNNHGFTRGLFFATAADGTHPTGMHSC